MVQSASHTGRPQCSWILLQFIPDPNTMLSNMLAGAADLTLSSSTSVEQGYTLQSQNWDGQIGIYNEGMIHFFVQYIDPANQVLTDKRFHKGLFYALDRQAFVDGIQHGYGGVVDVPLLASDPSFERV